MAAAPSMDHMIAIITTITRIIITTHISNSNNISTTTHTISRQP